MTELPRISHDFSGRGQQCAPRSSCLLIVATRPSRRCARRRERPSATAACHIVSSKARRQPSSTAATATADGAASAPGRAPVIVRSSQPCERSMLLLHTKQSCITGPASGTCTAVLREPLPFAHDSSLTYAANLGSEHQPVKVRPTDSLRRERMLARCGSSTICARTITRASRKRPPPRRLSCRATALTSGCTVTCCAHRWGSRVRSMHESQKEISSLLLHQCLATCTPFRK